MFFGTSKDISVGPVAIMSLLVNQFGSVVPGDPTCAILICFIGGLIQLAMGILSIGELALHVCTFYR